MGQNPSTPIQTDPADILFLKTKKRFYHPGEYVEGQVYLIIKQDRPYQKLTLTLSGDQSVCYQQEIYQGCAVQQRQISTYYSQFVLHAFGESAAKGEYVFPFKILLPSTITGSLVLDKKNYIKYSLQPRLIQTNKPNLRSKEHILNVIQLPKDQIRPTNITETFAGGCGSCFGCFDSGKVTIRLETSTNYIKSGDTIVVKFTIDNTEGTVPIDRVELSLNERITLLDYSIQQHSPHKYLSREINLTAGGKQEFTNKIIIPNIKNSSAIGNLLARYFLLVLKISYGYCRKEESAELHLIYNSRQPQLVVNEPFEIKSKWQLKQYPCATFENVKPYIYDPSPFLPFLNLPPKLDNKLKQNRQSGPLSRLSLVQSIHNSSNAYKYPKFMPESNRKSSKNKQEYKLQSERQFLQLQ